jgi:hypothetical protein
MEALVKCGVVMVSIALGYHQEVVMAADRGQYRQAAGAAKKIGPTKGFHRGALGKWSHRNHTECRYGGWDNVIPLRALRFTP